MVAFEGEYFNHVYREALRYVLKHGNETSPRGMLTREILGAQIRLTDPRLNILDSTARGLNYRFQIAEWLWIMLGQNDTGITTFNRNLMKFSDDSERFAGAYGPKLIDQLSYVVEVLTEDPDSRQAIVNIWRERPRASVDVPCTLSFQFLIRDKALHMVTTMRSNDVYLGLPYDLFTFTMLQNYLSYVLNVNIGTYIHNVGSLHLYEQHFEKAGQIVYEQHYTHYKSPRIRNIDGLEQARVWFNWLLQYGNGSCSALPNQNALTSLPYPWCMYMNVLASKWNTRYLSGVGEPYSLIYARSIDS